jgi:hypothetical protein
MPDDPRYPGKRAFAAVHRVWSLFSRSRAKGAYPSKLGARLNVISRRRNEPPTRIHAASTGFLENNRASARLPYRCRARVPRGRTLQWCDALITTPTPFGFNTPSMAFCDLRRQAFPYLKTPGLGLKDPSELRHANDPTIRQIRNPGTTNNRRNVMFAVAGKRNAAKRNHFVISVSFFARLEK